VKLECADGVKRLRDLELRVSILNDDFKEIDVKMENMLHAIKKKKKEQAVPKKEHFLGNLSYYFHMLSLRMFTLFILF
jgi:regulatory protein YycH of two-component signal transduction system YycFG